MAWIPGQYQRADRGFATSRRETRRNTRFSSDLRRHQCATAVLDFGQSLADVPEVPMLGPDPWVLLVGGDEFLQRPVFFGWKVGQGTAQRFHDERVALLE